MSNEGFIKLTRALSTDPDWRNARPTHQAIFITILLRMAYQETEQDCNGKKVKVKPCQLYISQLKLAEWTNKWITKDDVEGALKYFSRCNFLLHEVLHKKSMITVTYSDVCNEFIKSTPPMSPPQLLHDSSIKEEYKKEKNKKREIEKESPKSLSHSFSFDQTSDDLENPSQDISREESNIIVKSRHDCHIYVDPMLDKSRASKGEVRLTNEEFQKLVDRFGKSLVMNKIYALSRRLVEHPKKIKDHYLTLCNWLNKDAPALSKVISLEDQTFEPDPVVKKEIEELEAAGFYEQFR